MRAIALSVLIVAFGQEHKREPTATSAGIILVLLFVDILLIGFGL